MRGAYFQSKGLSVIPTISWGLPQSYWYCFDGIEEGSIVAVSTLGVKKEKDFFMKGYNEMLRRINPKAIICYCEPFDEMQGNIITVDYAETNNLRHSKMFDVFENNSVYKMGPTQTTPSLFEINRQYMIPLNQQNIMAGMGSGGSRGGSGGSREWKPSPNKPNDKRFLGKPGEKKTVYNRKGEKIETKIGKDGKATIERHYSDHHNPKSHTNPHDHKIDWSKGYPNPGKPINYPDGAPEFKIFEGVNIMCNGINIDDLDNSLNFTTVSEFKFCMESGGEIEFYWKGKIFCAFGKLQKTPNSNVQMYISEVGRDETEKWYDNAEQLMEYTIDGDRLRDVITKVKVIDRTI